MFFALKHVDDVMLLNDKQYSNDISNGGVYINANNNAAENDNKPTLFRHAAKYNLYIPFCIAVARNVMTYALVVADM